MTITAPARSLDRPIAAAVSAPRHGVLTRRSFRVVGLAVSLVALAAVFCSVRLRSGRSQLRSEISRILRKNTLTQPSVSLA